MKTGDHNSSSTASVQARLLPDLTVQLHPEDHVALAKIDLARGLILVSTREPGDTTRITVRDQIPSGHKLALRRIAAGETVLRYGQIIGIADRTILPGEHVHTHNLSSPHMARELAAGTDVAPIARSTGGQPRTFLGYRRADGRVGTRNYLAVISTVDCAAPAALRIAQHFTPARLAATPNVDGVITLTHHSGCSIRRDGPDYVWLQSTLAGMAQHPNVAGYILVGLGCEVNQIADLVANHGLTRNGGQPVEGLIIQELGGVGNTIRAGIARIEAMLPTANARQRTPQPIAALTLALQCGGSDAWSGVTANPVVGLVSDEVVGAGGTVVLAETPEIYGAEHLLTQRAINPEVAQALMEQVHWWEEHARRQGTEIDNNPTPGNKAGGLTTIYEKALGAVAKSGNTPLMAVYDYAARVSGQGVTFMNSPGNDPASVTGQVAGGCNLVLFTTGRGSVFGFKPAPCLKIVSNSETYNRMADDMDFDAGRVLAGMKMEEAATELLDLIIETASGRPSKSEALGIGEEGFSPWRYGETV